MGDLPCQPRGKKERQWPGRLDDDEASVDDNDVGISACRKKGKEKGTADGLWCSVVLMREDVN